MTLNAGVSEFTVEFISITVNYIGVKNMIDISFQKDSVKTHLQSFLKKISEYQNFNADMSLILYLRKSDNDFIAFEACEYTLGFISTAYKFSSFYVLMQDDSISKYKLTYNQLVDLIG